MASDCRAIMEVPAGGVGNLPRQEFAEKLIESSTGKTHQDTEMSHNGSDIDNQSNCSIHGERSHLFCMDCCTVVCSSCIRNFHRGHDCRTLQDAGDTGREGLRVLLHDQRRHLVAMNKGADDMREYEWELRSTRRRAIKEVREQADAIRNTLLSLEKSLIIIINNNNINNNNNNIIIIIIIILKFI